MEIISRQSIPYQPPSPGQESSDEESESDEETESGSVEKIRQLKVSTGKSADSDDRLRFKS